MKRPWAALVLVLALSVFMPEVSAAQSQDTGNRARKSGMSLGQNYPNPAVGSTTLRFHLGNLLTEKLVMGIDAQHPLA